MRPLRSLLLLSLLWLTASLVSAQSQEERVLLEMLLARDPAAVVAHLPEVVRDAIEELSPPDRVELNKFIMARKQFCERVKCSVPADGHAALVAQHSDSYSEEIRLLRKVSDGANTVLQFEIGSPGNRAKTLQVWMALERGVWRLTELHGPDVGDVVYDKDFVSRFVHARLKANESGAIGSMRTLNTSLVTYASTYPEVGFAESIAALDGAGGDSAHAGLIDSRLASGEKSGYRFEYRKTSRFTYAVAARPIKYGETGTKSFFTDQSGVIRFTEEDRAPTAADQPLQ